MSSPQETHENSKHKAKKYLLKIYAENTEHLDNLSGDDRDRFINEAIKLYLGNYSSYKQKVELYNLAKKIAVIGFTLLMTFIVIFSCMKFMSMSTKKTNHQMQENFEVLFDKYNVPKQ